MFIVLLAGALVTKTGAGRGCGDDWPLCNGKFIPAYTLESIIEYNHRAVTGVVGILVLITFIAIYKSYSRRSEAFVYASGVLFFTVLQAILGAMAVKWEQSSAVMALHFGFSMLALTFTLLLVARIWRTQEKANNPVPVRTGFMKLVWVTTIYSYIVVYIGAYVRHTDSSGGCTGWPLCNNEWMPELSGPTGIAFLHRAAALLLLVMVGWMSAQGLGSNRNAVEIRRLSAVSITLVMLQIFSGGFVVATMNMANVYLFASMLHTTIIAALFAVLSYMSIRVWQLRERGPQ